MKKFLKNLGSQVKEAVSGVVGDNDDVQSNDDNGGNAAHIQRDGSCMMRGELEVTIIAARDLPDTDNIFFNIGKLIDKKDVTDPFVTGYLGPCKVLMTSVKDNTMDPVWNEKQSWK